MSDSAQPAAAAPTTAEKVDVAIGYAAKTAELFAPQAALAIEAGVAAEPIFRSFVQMIINVFRHHAK